MLVIFLPPDMGAKQALQTPFVPVKPLNAKKQTGFNYRYGFLAHN